MNAHWSEFLRSHDGGIEVNRLVSFFGGMAFIISAVGFEWWRIRNGGEFDVTAWCLAFPGGIGLLVGGTGVGVALKDRNVAHAKVVSETGSRPADPPAPAPKVQPELADAPADTVDERPPYAR